MFLKIFKASPNDQGHDLYLLTHRDDQPTTDVKLAHQWFWHKWRTGRDNDTVKRCFFFQANVPITKNELFGTISQLWKKLIGNLEQFQLPFNAIDLCSQFTQYCCLVATSRTNLENFVASTDLKQFCLKCHGIGLRNGLSCRNGKGFVLVRMVQKTRIHEQMSRNLAYGSQHLWVADALIFNNLNKLLPQTLMFKGIFQCKGVLR